MLLNGTAISWSTDVGTKYVNPAKAEGQTLCEAAGFSNTSKLPNWRVPACQLGTDTGATYSAQQPKFGSNGVGYENEDLIVWMRTAALPSFRKLYRRIDGGLAKGAYKLTIDYNYPVTAFGGKKYVVVTDISWLGGKNNFLGIAYLVVGGLLIFFGVVFILVQSRVGRELGSDKYLSWDRE